MASTRANIDCIDRWQDNVFVESIEDVYLKEYDSIPDIRQGLQLIFNSIITGAGIKALT